MARTAPVISFTVSPRAQSHQTTHLGRRGVAGVMISSLLGREAVNGTVAAD
jgi:hypothetical protein